MSNLDSTVYVINGFSNPTLSLIRGQVYIFNVNALGHPFWIKDAAVIGVGSAFTSGVTNNGADVGAVTFTVPDDAPDMLYYHCQFHEPMGGTFASKSMRTCPLFFDELQCTVQFIPRP